MPIEVSSQLIELLRLEADRTYPEECCGILLGQGGRLTGIQPTRNVHASPTTHFEIDPQTLIDCHRTARHGGPQVMGYFHSHPTTAPRPSPTDAAMAPGDGMVWAIVGRNQIKLWRDEPSGFAPLSYTIVGI
ncbi:Mov34/MPN/PAD-1 family protein [Parerythrobacter jejuensis]|uniref:Peptidase n=1 Tax=Parerythrobacter jejuensis TaxID=795812 RepID=A0A845AL88_9SPHN|nr:M67 family metallopeptidase [Parerythrobacter jejuensis]MXP31532.1 peptidase [Parerythrobacter jejuensis]